MLKVKRKKEGKELRQVLKEEGKEWERERSEKVQSVASGRSDREATEVVQKNKIKKNTSRKQDHD